jgi:hypothetical protein
MADPKKYRDEAERLRKEAAEAPDFNVRRQILQIAKLYDRLSESIEKRQETALGLFAPQNAGTLFQNHFGSADCRGDHSIDVRRCFRLVGQCIGVRLEVNRLCRIKRMMV